jgi:hypothetical protein
LISFRHLSRIGFLAVDQSGEESWVTLGTLSENLARGAEMAFTLKQALEFNKFTVSLAAAGLAYAATIGSPAEKGGVVPTPCVKWVSTMTLIAFALAVLFGTFVIGRASKIEANENERVNDNYMKSGGIVHSISLCIGLTLAATLMLNKIWSWF